MDEVALDYADYFKEVDFTIEISPICSSIEDMLGRLDEFESLLSSIKADTNNMMVNDIAQIVAHKKHFESLCERIDKLESFVELVNDNVNSIENVVTIAEQELLVSDYSIKGLLMKPLFGRNNKPTNTLTTNLSDEGEFRHPVIFKTKNYFGSES